MASTIQAETVIKAGFVQFDVRLRDVDANVDAALSGIRRLSEHGADLAVLPEMWSCGFDNLRLVRYAEKTPAIIDQVRDAALRHKMVIAGSLPEYANGRVYNTSYLIDRDGTLAGTYRKVHLFTLNLEHEFFGAGDRAVVCETSIGPIGLMVCYDLRFPELCRSLALKGARIVVVSAQWPAVRIRHWDILVRARAVENQIFMVAANRCGRDPDIEYGGHSQIISPNGEVPAAAGIDSCVGCASMDDKQIDMLRKQIPCLEERKPDVYSG